MPNRFSTETKGFDQNILERRLQSKLTAEIIDYSQFQSMFLRTIIKKYLIIKTFGNQLNHFSHIMV